LSLANFFVSEKHCLILQRSEVWDKTLTQMFKEDQYRAALQALKMKEWKRKWGGRGFVLFCVCVRAGSWRMSLPPFHYQYCSGVLALSALSWERCRVTRPHCHTHCGNVGD